jgi:hypothetical protein
MAASRGGDPPLVAMGPRPLGVIPPPVHAAPSVWVGHPVKKMLFSQMVPKSFLSVLIHSTRCKYDSLDFFLQKSLTGTCPLGGSKSKLWDSCRNNSRFLLGY